MYRRHSTIECHFQSPLNGNPKLLASADSVIVPSMPMLYPTNSENEAVISSLSPITTQAHFNASPYPCLVYTQYTFCYIIIGQDRKK